MFEKWIQDWAQRIEKLLLSIDPSKFGDPVAMQTKWMPIKGGGTNFRTHNLIRTAPHRTEFRASFQARVLAFIALSAGIGGIIFSYFINDSFTLNADKSHV